MSTDRKSVASVEVVEPFILAAPATMAQIMDSAAYKSIATVEDATAIINDAIATGTLIYGSGNLVKDFPSYWTLRFLATQEQSEKAKRPFHNATNSLLVRAAACKVFKNSPKPEGNGSTTVVRTKTAAPGDTVQIEWRGSITATLDGAYDAVLAHSTKLVEYATAQQAELTKKVLNSLSTEQIAMLKAMLNQE